MRDHILRADDIRDIVRKQSFKVRALAVAMGMTVRTLERHFKEQFGTTPKAWITRERMNFAPTLLADGLLNKEVAASLGYTCESNFCRDFKNHYGSTPQKFARSHRSVGVAF